MARPKKNNADYFSHESEMRNDVKIKALRRKFSHTGYAVWNYLLEVLTDAEGFSIKWEELNIELYAADFDLDVTELVDIVNYCIKLKLLQLSNGHLHCNNLTSSFESLMNKRGRNKAPDYNNPVVSDAETPQKESFGSRNPANPVVSDAETPIVEKSREEYIRVNNNYSSHDAHAHVEAPDATAGQEEEVFYKHFFFRNVIHPQDVTRKFIGWNQDRNWTGKDGRVRSTIEEKLNLAMQWLPTEPGVRCNPQFLKMWEQLYNMICKSEPEISALMLKENVSGFWRGHTAVIQCNSRLADFLKQKHDLLSPILDKWLTGRAVQIRYEPPQT